MEFLDFLEQHQPLGGRQRNAMERLFGRKLRPQPNHRVVLDEFLKLQILTA